MGCGESKHAVTGNTISRKNSRAGSKRGKSLEAIEETRKVDGKTSSSVQLEGENGDRDSGGVAAGSATVSRRNSRARSRKGKSSETVEETKKIDSGTSSMLQREEGENGDRDSGRDNSGARVDGKKIGESMELKKEDKTMAEERKEETVEKIKVVEDSMEDEKLGGDSKKETVKDQKPVEENKEEIGNGETETVKKEKKSKTAETTETEVSTPVEKQEEKPAGSSGVLEDLKKE